MIVEFLADHPLAIPKLADWYKAVWEPYYGDAGPGDALADLRARCNRGTLPVGLVAMDGDKVLGTAAVGFDVSANLAPSIIGLLVDQNHRRSGVAAALIESSVKTARRQGHQQIFISSSVLGSFLDQTGWREMGSVEFLNDEHGSIYVLDL